MPLNKQHLLFESPRAVVYPGFLNCPLSCPQEVMFPSSFSYTGKGNVTHFLWVPRLVSMRARSHTQPELRRLHFSKKPSCFPRPQSPWRAPQQALQLVSWASPKILVFQWITCHRTPTLHFPHNWWASKCPLVVCKATNSPPSNQGGN